MNTSKLFTLLSAFLVIIALMLTVTSVTVLNNTVTESKDWHTRTASILSSLSNLEKKECEESKSSLAPDNETLPAHPTPPDTDADILYNKFCMRETNGKIGIYCDDGQLISLLDVSVQTLPIKDQKALSHGIYVTSWDELISLIQDYQ